MPTAVAITHVPFEDLGSLGAVLDERGFEIESLDACTADRQAFAALNPDLLVILGGPIGAYETDTYPFLAGEIELIRRRLQARLPLVGICLGAQLMAVALDAAVYPGRNGKEIGWSPVTAAEDAQMCPGITELFAPDLRVLHWHADTFDLPAGAAHLAASAQYPNQAYAFGTHALALQFHPEVSAPALERWYVGHACELGAAKVDIAQLRADGARYAPPLQEAARRLWRRWLDAAFAS